MADAEKLTTLYTRAGERLLELIRTLEDGNYSRRRKERLLKEVDEILVGLTDGAAQGMSELLAQAYKEGVGEASDSILAQGVPDERINTVLEPLIHQQAVQAIMDDTFFRILEANDNMSQDVKRRIEEVTRTATERMLTEGVNRRQATKEAIARITEQGITGIVTRNGARIPADKYMNGVVQYNLRKAHVTGAENTIKQNGLDLVYVNFVGITCEYCSKYQGRVYSISGADTRFPKLEIRPPYHAHCVHSVSAWIEEYQPADEVERMLVASNRPFTDNRTESNIRKYNEIQRNKSRKNETRKQWMRYKAALPNDTPNLRQFASQKARNTKAYQELQEDYRKIGQASRLPKQPTVQYKTFAEAKEALVKDLGFLEAESSLDILDKELLITNTNHLKKLEDRFGMIHESSGTIFAKSNVEAVSYVSSSPTNPSKQSLSLSPDSFRNKEQFLATRIKMVETGYSMPMALTEAELSVATVTHEYGHILQNVLIRKEMESLGWTASNQYKFLDLKKKSPIAMNKWYTDVTSTVRRQHLNEIVGIAKESNPEFDLMSSLSAYGKTNEAEFFAEVFMNSQLSKPNELGQAMNIWLERKGLIR